jgi:hypothetical protein
MSKPLEHSLVSLGISFSVFNMSMRMCVASAILTYMVGDYREFVKKGSQ